MSRAKINPYIIHWARERLNLSIEDVARKLNVKVDKVKEWESGKSFPTFCQAQKLAKIFSLPFGYLFLSEIPMESLPIPDLRTFPEGERRKLSADFFEVLYDALRKRDWYREFRIQEGMPPLEFVGKFKVGSDIVTVAQNMRKFLEISEDVFPYPSSSWQDHLQNLIKRAEKAGILVLCNSLVGNNPYRKLSVEEFRGFCIADQFAPIVFINKNDTKAAQIFTFAHELVHIWIGESGVSNAQLDPTQSTRIEVERFCNQVAAEFLVPAKIFIERWDKNKEIMSNAKRLAEEFRVSTLVILRRGYDLNLIPKDEFKTLFMHEIEIAKQYAKEATGGGNAYLNIIRRNSARFVYDLLRATLAGQVLYREAARLLNVKVNTLDRLIKQFLESENALLFGY